MKRIVLWVVGLGVMAGSLGAEPWVTEQWRYDVGGYILTLGPVWLEDGSLYATIGKLNDIEIVRNGNRYIDNDRLNGWFTSLVRGDFDEEEGDELAAYTCFNDTGVVFHLFSGERFQMHESRCVNRLGGFFEYCNYQIEWISDRIFREDSVSILPYGFSLDFVGGSPHNPVGGSTGWLISRLENEGGSPTCIGATDTDDDGNYEYFFLLNRSEFSQILGGDVHSSSEVMLAKYSQAGQEIISKRLAYDYSDVYYGGADYTCKTLGGAIYEADDACVIIGSYTDTSGGQIEEFWPDNFNTRRRTSWSLDQPADMFIVQEDQKDYLLAFTQRGEVYQFNLTDWEEVGSSQLRDTSVVETKLGNFDRDPDWEIMQLTNSSLVLYDLHALNVFDQHAPAPFALALLSTFPNPFNSSTTINYSLPQPGRYAIDVVDIQGRLVTRLSDGWKEAGSYREVFNGESLPSGEYLIRLDGTTRASPGRITLIR